MKVVINILLVALICLLGYMLYNSIKEPIAFQEVKEARQLVVTDKLSTIREAQELYRSIKGDFANSFDTLSYVLRNDSIKFEKIIGDPDDPTNADKFERIVTYSMAIDSVNSMGWNLDSLRFVPFTEGKTFDIQADTISYQSTNVAVVEVGTRWESFMGKYATAKFKRYDSSYEPKAMIKFGDMNKPSLSGNW